jgi:monoamine oxidase
MAARTLVRAGKKVVVLEARDRVGGRVKAGKIAGRSVDVGGMWVGPTQTRSLDTIKEYGLHLVPQFEDGKDIAEMGGKRSTGNREDMGLDAKSQVECDEIIREWNRLAAQVPIDAPWTKRWLLDGLDVSVGHRRCSRDPSQKNDAGGTPAS